MVGFVSYAAYSLAQTLKKLTSIFDKVDDITKTIDEIKNSIKYGIQSLMSIFLKKTNKLLKKGGDKGGK